MAAAVFFENRTPDLGNGYTDELDYESEAAFNLVFEPAFHFGPDFYAPVDDFREPPSFGRFTSSPDLQCHESSEPIQCTTVRQMLDTIDLTDDSDITESEDVRGLVRVLQPATDKSGAYVHMHKAQDKIRCTNGRVYYFPRFSFLNSTGVVSEFNFSMLPDGDKKKNWRFYLQQWITMCGEDPEEVEDLLDNWFMTHDNKYIF